MHVFQIFNAIFILISVFWDTMAMAYSIGVGKDFLGTYDPGTTVN